MPLSPLPNESNQINQVKETQESQEDFEVRTIVAQAAERQKLETPTTPVRLSVFCNMLDIINLIESFLKILSYYIKGRRFHNEGLYSPIILY